MKLVPLATLIIVGAGLAPRPLMAQAAADDAPISGRSGSTDEIVVTGRRADAAVEFELDRDEIEKDGIRDVGGVLADIQQSINPMGDETVLLINGKPAGFDDSILTYPSSALESVTVLKRGVGPAYGASGRARVVNLVLKSRFSDLELNVGVNAATAGGQHGGTAGSSRNAIDGKLRWSVHVQDNWQSPLLAASRGIPPNVSVVGLRTGVVSGGGEAVPGWDVDRAMNRDTLQPRIASRSAGFNVTRALGPFSTSLSVDVSGSSSRGRDGVTIVALDDPVGIPAPDAGTFLTGPPSRIENSTRIVSSTLNASGMVGGFRTSLGAALGRTYGTSLFDAGLDLEAIRRLVDAPGVDPNALGPIGYSYSKVTRDRARNQSFNGRLDVRRSFLRLPAGPVSWNLGVTINRSVATAAHLDGASAALSSAASSQFSGHLNADLPIFSENGRVSALGNLDLNMGMAVQASGIGSQTSYSGGVTWSPVAEIQLVASIDQSGSVPTFQQLHAPALSSTVRVLDYEQQTYSDVVRSVGGNPDLRRGSQRNVTMGVTLDPLKRHSLVANLAYHRFVAADLPTTFPELTSAVEAAFPARFTRDAAGRLLAIDASPINIRNEESADLRASVSLRLGGIGMSGGRRLKSKAGRPQFNLQISYRLRLEDRTVIRDGLPELDRLSGFGLSRHEVGGVAGARSGPFSASTNVVWRSGARLDGPVGALDIRPQMTIDLSSALDVASLHRHGTGTNNQKGLQVSIDVQNVLRSYRHIVSAGGHPLSGFSRNEVDPLGRVVRLTVRKHF